MTAVKLRQRERGLVLLSTLITLLVLASVVMAVQKTAQSNVLVLGKLAAGFQEQSGRDAVYERLRGLVADAMTGTVEGRPVLNASDFAIQEGGRDWVVRVQDVEGLVDVYLAPVETLRILPLNAEKFAAAREQVLARLGPGERFPTLDASLARFGANSADLKGVVTQTSQTGSLRVATMPELLRLRAPKFPQGVREGEQVTRVTVSIERMDG